MSERQDSRRTRSGEVVWKFPLRAWSIFLDIPRGARILSVGVQGQAPVEEAVVWALCDPEAPKVSRLVASQPTGVSLPPALDGSAFVGTFTIEDGLVFHVFDGGER